MIEILNQITVVSTPEWIRAGIAIAAIMMIVLGGEVIFKYVPNGSKYSRKFVHIFVGIAVAFLPSYGLPQVLAVIIGLFFALANYVTIKLQMFKGIHHKPDSYGTVFFPLSFTFLCLVSWDQPWHIIIPLLAMAMGDGIASLVGENAKNPVPVIQGIRGKSRQGSSVLALIVLLLFVYYFFVEKNAAPDWLFIVSLFAGALIVMTSELIAWRGSDNLTVPLFTWVIIRLVDTGGAETVLFTTLLVILIAILSYRFKFLSISGSVAVVLLAFFLFAVGAWAWTIPILTFFVASSLLSKLPDRKKLAKKKYEKGSQRDASQVFANGILPALFILFAWLSGNELFFDLHIIALAGATADTWATELGGRYGPRKPFHLRLLKKVPAGTSGAVSLTGFISSFSGGALIGIVALFWTEMPWYWAATGGLLISLIDSVLGAFFQKQYICPTCGDLTEKAFHCQNDITDNESNLYGWQFLNNNKVNILSMVLGCLTYFSYLS